MKQTDRIKEAIIDFVEGGDNSDVKRLNQVLHKNFRVTNNGFLGSLGVTVINKSQYLEKIKSGIFGGLPRKMTIERIEQSEIIASVKLRLESIENDFISYNSLVLDTDDRWKIINNLAVVKAKSKKIPRREL